MQQAFPLLAGNRVLGNAQVEQSFAVLKHAGMWRGAKELIELSRQADGIHRDDENAANSEAESYRFATRILNSLIDGSQEAASALITFFN